MNVSWPLDSWRYSHLKFWLNKVIGLYHFLPEMREGICFGLHSRPFREVCVLVFCVYRIRRQVNITALCDGFENLLLKMDDCKKTSSEKKESSCYFQVFRREQFLHFTRKVGMELSCLCNLSSHGEGVLTEEVSLKTATGMKTGGSVYLVQTVILLYWPHWLACSQYSWPHAWNLKYIAVWKWYKERLFFVEFFTLYFNNEWISLKMKNA